MRFPSGECSVDGRQIGSEYSILNNPIPVAFAYAPMSISRQTHGRFRAWQSACIEAQY